MKRVRRILVPVDFSKTSAAAVRTAVRIASRSKARVSLLHVYPFPRGSFSAYRTMREIEADAKGEKGAWTSKSKRTLSAWVTRYQKPGVTLRKLFAIGRPAEEIKTVAVQIKADLIVIGTRGLGGLKGAIIGSTAAEAIRLTDAPVLTVHEGRGATGEASRVVVGDDFGDGGDAAIAAAVAFVDPKKARVLLLHVVDPAPLLYAGAAEWGWIAATDTLAEDEKLSKNKIETRAGKLRRKGFKVECRVVTGPPAQTITRVAKGWKAQLLIVATHGRRGVSRVLIGNTADQLLRSVRTPILTVRPERK
ncbi:MAG: universal stress protein [Deltaproteobacteria bacterium]|nr:universal stress protein [Deltaproteobacteria bacterium]